LTCACVFCCLSLITVISGLVLLNSGLNFGKIRSHRARFVEYEGLWVTFTQFMTGNFCTWRNEKELAEKPVASMPFLRTFSLNIFPMSALVTVYETVKLRLDCIYIFALSVKNSNAWYAVT